MNSVANTRLERSEVLLNAHLRFIGGAIVICGLLWRLHYASDFYLNPDEALHYLVASQQSLASHDFHGWTRIAHPPLFTLILRGMLHFGHSEWILRLVPMAAGAMFPWFVMLWVRHFASNAAALCAQLLLTFSPTMIDLSTEVRAYTLAFLFLSISLLLLEAALDRGSTTSMAWFHVFLYLAILTEYCVGWMVAAVGLYALVRLWSSQGRGGIRIVWMIGQAGALGLYAILFKTQVSKWPQNGLLGDPVNTWMQTAFLQPGQHVLTFVLKGTLRQFMYLLGIRLLAPLGAAAFVFGLYRLWKSRQKQHVLLVGLPFCLACLGGIFHLFPYGPSRHTAILGIAAAAGLGCAVAAITRNRMLPIAVSALLLIPIWNGFAEDSYFPIPRFRRSALQLRESIQYLRSQVPAGSAVVTDRGTDMILAYYLQSHNDSLYSMPYDLHESAGLRIIVAPPFGFTGDAAVREALSKARQKYHLDGPVWVAAQGYPVPATVKSAASNALPFLRTIAVFESSDLPTAIPSSGPNSSPNVK